MQAFAYIFILLLGGLPLIMGRDIIDFFPDAKGNLTKITWAHAVNNQSLLNEALNNDVMMIEADVQIGKLINGTDDIPIMAHPPNKVSDLSLEEFLNQTLEFNNKNGTSKKGIKLDFKSIEAFNGSLHLLNNNLADIMPVWINADILPGPVNATTIPVDANQFLKQSASFSEFTLSIGWTTLYNVLLQNNSYTDAQITEMIDVIKQTNTKNPITFPVRAGLAAESLNQMQKLIDEVGNSTITIWSSQNDPVNVDKLRNLIVKIGLDKVFIDVPKELEDQLRLDTIKSSSVKSQLSLTALFVLVFMILFN